MTAGPETSAPYDPAALRRKYLAERDKRLRTDKQQQYLEASGAFEGFARDPYVEPGFSRAPRSSAASSPFSARWAPIRIWPCCPL